MIALLTENGFIVNPSDAQKLKSDAYIKLIAQGHVNGIVSFYGLKKKPKSPTSPITTGGENISRPSKLFKVQVGAFSNRANAEELAKKLEKSGYKPFISEE
jgi:N-acetylmuramoyl-L-alanine amidase